MALGVADSPPDTPMSDRGVCWLSYSHVGILVPGPGIVLCNVPRSRRASARNWSSKSRSTRRATGSGWGAIPAMPLRAYAMPSPLSATKSPLSAFNPPLSDYNTSAICYAQTLLSATCNIRYAAAHTLHET
eukprot:3287656-Rhodomonas_salina.1